MHIELVPGRGCNFRCRYCYEGAYLSSFNPKQKLSEEVIEQFCSFYNGLDKAIPIIFYGGESLLYSKEIEKILMGIKKERLPPLNIVTNGVLVESCQQYISKWAKSLGQKFCVNVSYDYALQDKNRCHGTYQKVRDAILWLDKHDIHVATNTVFPRDDIGSMKEVFEDYLDLRRQLKRKFPFRIGLDCSNHCGSVYDREPAEEGLRKLSEFVAQHPECANLISYKFGAVKGSRYFHCGLGYRVLMGIDYDGSLYPCQGAIFDEHKDMFRFGHISDGYDEIMRKRAELLAKLKHQDLPECKACDAACKVCPLETIKTSYAEFGGMPPKENCEIHKTMSKYIKFYDRSVARKV